MTSETNNQEQSIIENQEKNIKEKKYKKKSNYYCEQCSYLTDRKCNWDTHISSNKHKRNSEIININDCEKNIYICDKCDTDFDNMEKLSNHKLTCKKKIYKCKGCNKEYNHCSSYHSHMKVCTEKNYVKLNIDIFSKLVKNLLTIDDLMNDDKKRQYIESLINESHPIHPPSVINHA